MKIMQVGLSESEFGKIPSTVDQVLFGNLDRSKTHNIKALFVLGMNDGVIPSKALDEGFLNDWLIDYNWSSTAFCASKG